MNTSIFLFRFDLEMIHSPPFLMTEVPQALSSELSSKKDQLTKDLEEKKDTQVPPEIGRMT